MDNKKLLSNVLLVAGILLLILSLIADFIGIGLSPGYGTYQIIGMVVGVIAAIAGFVLARRK